MHVIIAVAIAISGSGLVLGQYYPNHPNYPYPPEPTTTPSTGEELIQLGGKMLDISSDTKSSSSCGNNPACFVTLTIFAIVFIISGIIVICCCEN